MNRYVLLPEDGVKVLPPQEDAEAALEIFCSRTMIFFALSEVEAVCLMHGVPDGRESIDALCLTATDRLLARKQMVLIPVDHPGYAQVLEELRRYAPQTLDFTKEAQYIPETCDHNGHHHG